MIYADEAFYTENYLLGRKPVISTGFLFYARQASQIIDRYTFGRLKSITEDAVPEEVHMCCCELAESGYRQERQQKELGGKMSEKIGTYSASFESTQDSASAFEQEQRAVVMKWLAGTGLCYLGVR
jgi:hypothetical protein